MKHQKLITTEQTSQRMSKVKLKEGKAETLLAKALWAKGIRYRKNYKKLPGSPDLAITKHKIAIFVDGEFWHGHEWDSRKEKLKNNREYWIEKIEENIERDKKNDNILAYIGWIPVHFWEKEVLKNLGFCVEIVESKIQEITGNS